MAPCSSTPTADVRRWQRFTDVRRWRGCGLVGVRRTGCRCEGSSAGFTWPRWLRSATRRETSTPGRTCETWVERTFEVARSPTSYDAKEVTLHDWIDELCDALEIDAEVDEGLVLDVARDAAHGVERPAAPITTYLLGYAAGLHGANPEKLEELAARASALAESWGGGSDDVDVDVPVDSEEIEIDEELVDVE